METAGIQVEIGFICIVGILQAFYALALWNRSKRIERIIAIQNEILEKVKLRRHSRRRYATAGRKLG